MLGFDEPHPHRWWPAFGVPHVLMAGIDQFGFTHLGHRHQELGRLLTCLLSRSDRPFGSTLRQRGPCRHVEIFDVLAQCGHFWCPLLVLAAVVAEFVSSAFPNAMPPLLPSVASSGCPLDGGRTSGNDPMRCPSTNPYWLRYTATA